MRNAAQPASSRQLISELYDFVKGALKDYPFPSPDGKWLDCRVFLHGLPDEMDAETYPFVVIRWAEGEIESEVDGKTVLKDGVVLILGVHAPRSQTEAGLLCAELLDVLRRAIWKKRILARRYELVEPLRAAIPGIEQKVHQFHMASIETVWNYAWPPKALEEAGQSQLASGAMEAGSYSAGILEDHNLI